MNKEPNMGDVELLREYVERQSEKAFAELVAHYINLVYSTALRMVREPTLAEDVAQAVFIQLARKAPTIRSGNALPGWLYHVTRCQAANAVRDDHTRRQRETEAMNMAQTNDEPSREWHSIAPYLEEAMSTLSDVDQNAVLQRFFQGRSWREVGAALALSEDTAQKRVSRAVEKLRCHFARRGIVTSSTVIASVVAAHAVHVAPAGLASTVTTASLAGAAGSSSFGLASMLTKTILMKKTIIVAIVVVATAVITCLTVAKVKHARASRPVTGENIQHGLVLHYTFDQDETGAEVADTSGKGNTGRASGVRWTPDGKNGGAYEFTADGDEIVVANNESLNPENLTLSVWVKTKTADHFWRRIFDKSYSRGYALSVAGDWQQNNWNGQICMEVGPGDHAVLSRIKVSDGQWHHVAATFDGTDQLVYVDGQLQGKLHRNHPNKAGTSDFNLVIGCNRSNLDNQYGDLGTSFRGLIDEPMMWNRALSEKEIAFLYQSQSGTSAGQTAVR